MPILPFSNLEGLYLNSLKHCKEDVISQLEAKQVAVERGYTLRSPEFCRCIPT